MPRGTSIQQKVIAFLLLFSIVSFAYAQEDDQDEGELPIITDRDIYIPELYTKGDQAFLISLGLIFPTVFLNGGKVMNHNFEPPVGGTGSLGYNYFLNSNFFLGGEIAGMFNSTLGMNTVFIIPIGFRIGYQFIVWRFEFPVSIMAGVNWHRFLEDGYFGFFLKGGGSVYYRFNPEWSFGLNANWNWLPEWIPDDPKKNVDGNIVDLTFSVRYHF